MCFVQDEESQELAIICLQKIVRGRALQKAMYDGKEKRIELIREMRSTHALQAAEQQLLQDEEQATVLLQQQQQSYELKVRDDCSGVEHIQSRHCGSVRN